MGEWLAPVMDISPKVDEEFRDIDFRLDRSEDKKRDREDAFPECINIEARGPPQPGVQALAVSQHQGQEDTVAGLTSSKMVRP